MENTPKSIKDLAEEVRKVASDKDLSVDEAIESLAPPGGWGMAPIPFQVKNELGKK